MFSSPTPLAALALSIIIASVTSSAVPARGWARAPRAPCAVQLGVRVRASVLLDAAATTADLAPAAAEPAAAAPRKRTRRGGRGGSGPGAQRRASADASRAAASSAAAQPASEAGAGEGVTTSAAIATAANPLNLRIGQVVCGTVKQLAPYGAFVLLHAPRGTPNAKSSAPPAGAGGADEAAAAAGLKRPRRTLSGLLHISQLSSKRVEDVATVLKLGQQIRCMVLALDDKGQPKLSTRSLEATPGEMLADADGLFERAAQTAKAARARESAERKARVTEAENVIFGLEGFGPIEHTCRVDEARGGGVECTPTANGAQPSS